MFIRIKHVPQQRRPEDAETEEEAEGEAEEDGGADGVGDDHGVHVPAPALLLEGSQSLWTIVLEHSRLDRGWQRQHEGEEEDCEDDSSVDLSLPLHLRGDSGELERNVD